MPAGANFWRLVLITLVLLLFAGCATKTRTMQEQTSINVVAETPVGPVKITGNIERRQNEQTKVEFTPPPWLKAVSSGVGTYLSGGAGIGGLLYGLWATRKRRLEVEKKERQKESETAELAKKRDYYLRELCRGISKYLNQTDKDHAIALRACLKESLSKDTRDAIRDFI